MFEKNRKLHLFFGILLLICIFQIGYYYMSSQNNTQHQADIKFQTLQKNAQNQKLPRTTPAYPTPKHRINPDTLMYIRRMPNQILESSIISSTYTVEVTGIKKNDYKDKNLHNVLRLEFKDTNNGLGWFNYFENDLKHMTVSKNGQNIDISKLAPGDHIRVQETLDLTKPFGNNRTDITITVL